MQETKTDRLTEGNFNNVGQETHKIESEQNRSRKTNTEDTRSKQRTAEGTQMDTRNN